MHIYLQWDPWTKKERVTRIENPWPGNNWSSLGFLSTTLNIKAPLSTIRLKSLQNPRHTSQGPPKLFLFLGRQNKMALFIQGHSVGWDNPRCLSSKKTLPKRPCTPGHIPAEPSQSTLSFIFLCPGCTFSIRCTHFGQPLPFLHQV